MCTGRNRSHTTSRPGRQRAGEGVAEEVISRAGFSLCPGSWGEWHSSTNSNFRTCLLTCGIILVLFVFSSHCTWQTQHGEIGVFCLPHLLPSGPAPEAPMSWAKSLHRAHLTRDLRNFGPCSFVTSFTVSDHRQSIYVSQVAI